MDTRILETADTNTILKSLVVFAKTEDGAEGSDWVVVVTGFIAITSLIAITSRVTYQSVRHDDEQ
jgi:hypothetical protein